MKVSSSDSRLHIVRCGDDMAQRWDDFVRACPMGSPYHLYPWRQVNRRYLGHESVYLAACDQEQSIKGVLPLVHVKSRLFGNIACSMPFVNYGGLCASDPRAEAPLVEEALRVASEWRVDYLEIRGRAPVDGLPGSNHKVSMTVDLNVDPDVLFRGFKTGHRQDIRRGYKAGLVARHGGAELVDDLYRVLVESWRNLGTPIYALDYFRAVCAAFQKQTRICVVYAGSEPAAAALDMVFADRVEGLWLGSRERYRRQYAGYVLYWELIKDACEMGQARFHLGRSTVDSGGEIFKRKWNARPTPLFWQYGLRTTQELPQLNVDNPKYRLAMNAWRRLPLAVTQVLGPRIARSIP